ncbi:CsbD family protein [Ramlibacter sp. G-1-2-2]|uniref:CsbD family protein n=1 Tax=Ramlibacter agri TaxID=2728837 RepID=A0A848H5L5_9BURK|nr:CsbD family protein [Ramlibacter agri]NML46085.1 CsbD family protein [Ramlibacter agri]
MNQDRIQGRWKQLKGKVREQWGKLTDDDLDVIAGRRDQLLGRIQQRHGLAKDEAERQVKNWEGRNPEFRLDGAPQRRRERSQ